MSYKPIDGAKEDFRRYLDRKGVMDTLTKAFISCYDDRPENPIERLLEVLSDTSRQLPSNYRTKLEAAEVQLAEAKLEIDVLRKQLEGLGVKPVEVPKPPNTVSANVPTPSTPAISAATVAAAVAAAAATEKSPEPATADVAENEESAKPAVVAAAAVAAAAPSSSPVKPVEPVAVQEAQPATVVAPTTTTATAVAATEEQPSTST